MKILMNLHVLRLPESKNYIIVPCVCVCVTSISVIQKQFTAGILNLVFYICIAHRCYLKLFMKIEQNSAYRGTQKDSNILQPMDGLH